jgi:hypothetical protein
MKKNYCIVIVALFVLASLVACKKHHDSPALTTANLAGTYQVKSIVITRSIGTQPVGYDIFAALDPCVKDNEIKLNTNLTVSYNDIGVVCNPPSVDPVGDWTIVGTDSLQLTTRYFDEKLDGGTIKSFDGTTLVVLSGDMSGLKFTET